MSSARRSARAGATPAPAPAAAPAAPASAKPVTAEAVAAAAETLLRASQPPSAAPTAAAAPADAAPAAKRARTAQPVSVPVSTMPLSMNVPSLGNSNTTGAAAAAAAAAAASSIMFQQLGQTPSLASAGHAIDALLSAPEPVPDFATASGRKRRQRREWTVEEIRDLETGVGRHGVGKWARVLHDPELVFHDRTVIDLKDKWRNLKHYTAYSSKKKRRYILLDAQHRPVHTENMGVHCFTNRWPRDAALKVASRTMFYEFAGVKHEEISIYLREFVGNNIRKPGTSPTSDIVHVFIGRRTKQAVPAKRHKEGQNDADLPVKFAGRDFIWVPEVRKIREEKYLHLKAEQQFAIPKTEALTEAMLAATSPGSAGGRSDMLPYSGY